MKKQSLLLIATALVAFTACQSESTGYSEEQVDSTVNARVEEIRMQMMMQNDSIISALAIQRADSIIAAMKGGNEVTTTTRRTTTVRNNPNANAPSTTTTTTKPQTVGQGKPAMGDGNTNTVGQGKPKMGEGSNSNTVGSGKPKMGDDSK